MSVSGIGNNTFNVQGTGQFQRTQCSPKMKKTALSLTSVVLGAGAFLGGFAIASSGMQENGNKAERLGGGVLAFAGMMGMMVGVISLVHDRCRPSQQPVAEQQSNV